ncbi:MAG: hypothetical protein BGO99_02145 [Nitrosospira sp. 56-18]|nr:MAG: hypothetical protein BGO99_02145 [Nitrosospira sp. 56-18]
MRFMAPYSMALNLLMAFDIPFAQVLLSQSVVMHAVTDAETRSSISQSRVMSIPSCCGASANKPHRLRASVSR